MSIIQYNFKSIPPIPKSNELIDIILSRTQRQTPTETHPGYKITRIRKFYMRKVKFTYDTIEEKIDGIVKSFPKLDDIHPFYSDLINILYDKDHYKMALGNLNSAKNTCEKICGDYVKLLKYGDSLYRCKQLKVAALGRMMTILKKLNSSLNYLEEVRKHLGRLPSIDPTTRTLLLSGFPNVGKSSFMNKITYADSEVQPYHFTTQSLYVGHTFYKNIKWQVIDTPGILDRSLEERNIIEMQAITALAHLEACVLYFVDVSENCGYSIQQQVNLFTSIRPLFKNKPLVIIANKTDLRPYNDLPEADRQALENAAKEHNTYLIQMSNITGEGVSVVKSSACDILLKYREANQSVGHKDITGLDKIYIATPKIKRDNRKREPYIPQSYIEQQLREQQEQQNENDEDKELKFLREDNIDLLEKKIKHNKYKDIINANGGDGVFFFNDRDHFKLEKEEWKYDVWPEIMDGKNVFDFVDKDILKKVEQLEKEENEIQQRELEKQMEMDIEGESDESSELSEELVEAHDKMMRNQKKLEKRHQLVKRSKVPKRLAGDTETDKFMDEVRPDLKEKAEKVRLLTLKLRREQKEKAKNSMKSIIPNDDDKMDIDDEQTTKKRKLNDNSSQKIYVDSAKENAINRMRNKIQKKWNRDARVNDADRTIQSQKPKHLNTGKRGLSNHNRR